MSDIKLGQLAPPSEVRDAVHMAVVVVQLGGDFLVEPGTAVKLTADGKAVHCDDYQDAVGIVDPFLRCEVIPGEWFYLCLKPGVVSSLRHVWAHPAFPLPGPLSPQDSKATSKAWLEGWAQAARVSLEHPTYGLLAEIDKGTVCFGITDFSELLEGSEDDNTQPFSAEFWRHYEQYTGKLRPKHAIQFRCAC